MAAVLMPPDERDTIGKLKPILRDSVEVIRQRADAVISDRTASADAKYFALIARDYVDLRLQHAQALDNLTDVQVRCDDLLGELRLLKVRLSLPKE
jgi:hypothetical protein